MPNQTDGKSSQANISVPLVPGLSPSTVEAIYRRMRRRGERSGDKVVTAFYQLDANAQSILLVFDMESGVLAWSYGERPTFNETIRSVEEITAKKKVEP